mgnify:CR=1 FL=1
MKQKSIKNIRQEFKDNGIFYTPLALAERLKSYDDFAVRLLRNYRCSIAPSKQLHHIIKIQDNSVCKERIGENDRRTEMYC